MNSQNLLVELLTEELPPKALRKLAAAFAEGIERSLCRQNLATEASCATVFATPRRLAIHLTAVLAQATEHLASQKVVAVQVRLDAQGQATPTLLTKLAALGAEATVVPQLRQMRAGKSNVLFLDRTQPGESLADGLQIAL